MHSRVKMPDRGDNVDLMLINAEDTAAAGAWLSAAFVWSETKEGYDYWAGIQARLFEIAEKAEYEDKVDS